MPSLVLVAAAYAAYKQNQKQQTNQLTMDNDEKKKEGDDGDTDPSQQQQEEQLQQTPTFSLKGKTIIPLLHGIEQEPCPTTAVGDCSYCGGGMYHAAPISTITFCSGDPVEASEMIGTKLGRVLQCNPWLTGWILRGKRLIQSHDDDAETDANHDSKDEKKKKSLLYLCYDPKCNDVSSTKEIFQLVVPGDNDIQLSQTTTKYEDICTLLESNNLLVERNENLVVNVEHGIHKEEDDDDDNEEDNSKERNIHNPSKSLLKVSIIPDANSPKNQYAVVVSMSHLLGDACTYYQIWNMLLSHENEYPVVALQPNRNQQYQSTLQRIMSSSETKRNGTSNDNRDSDDQTRHDGDEVALNRKQIFNLISNSYTSSSSSCANNGPATTLLSRWAKSRDPTELRIFTVSEEYIQRHKYEETIAASKNDDKQHEDDTSKEDRVNREGRTNPSSSSSSSAAPSTNSILTSSFFQATNANVGFMVCNMRNRLLLPETKESTFDAGNFTHEICLHPTNFETPMKVQQSLDEFLNRCRTGIPDQTEDAITNGSAEIQESETYNKHNKSKYQLPTLQRMNFKISISNNWSTFWKGNTIESQSCNSSGGDGDGTQPERDICVDAHPIILHLPVHDNEFVTQSLPHNMSMMTLFTLQPGSISTTSDGNASTISKTEQPSKAKLGAYVLAPRSVWPKIEASGIIDEYYWSFRKDYPTAAHAVTNKATDDNVGALLPTNETESHEEIKSESTKEGGIYDKATSNTGHTIWSLKSHPRSMLNSYLTSLRRETVPSGDDL